MIIWLAHYPRSGGHFLKEVLLRRHWGFAVETLGAGEPPAGTFSGERLPAQEAANCVCFVATSALPRDDTRPALYLIRDGRDALVSYARAQMELEQQNGSSDRSPLFGQTLRDLMTRPEPRGTWSRHVDAWTARPGTAVIRFEDLIRDPTGALLPALNELGIRAAAAPGALPAFERLQAENPLVYRSGKVGAWRQEMPGDLKKLFWEHHGPTARKWGYHLADAHVGDLEDRIRDLQDQVRALKDEIRRNQTDLGKQFEELVAKERVIQDFLQRKKAPTRMQRCLLWMKGKFRGYAPGVLHQYAPRRFRAPRFEPLPEPARWPTLSVVTPSYNQGTFLPYTMRSVLDSKYPSLEYVVMDGGSTDGSRATIESAADRLAYWISERDQGQSDAIQRGFENTRGEIMAWLNSDDLYMRGALRHVGSYFAAHPDVDVVYSHRIVLNCNGKEIGRWLLPEHSDEMLRWADFVPQETLFWRRSIWEKAGGRVDTSLTYAIDWDLLLRFKQAGAKIVRLPVFLGAFRVHADQKTKQAHGPGEHGYEECKRIRNNLHGREVPDKEVCDRIEPYLEEARRYVRRRRFRLVP
ncbi:MAG: glycosyltransferase [Planctomycetota bacterium]|nr:glycosyltransferase [Planctomycetota bacterium]